MKKLTDSELKTIRKSQVEVVLDPDTAHPYLVLSKDGKKVTHGNQRIDVNATDKRFSQYVNVLGKQSYTGRFYFEVQIKGKTKWNMGVAREGVNRQDMVPLNPPSGFWALTLRDVKLCKAAASPPATIRLKKPLQKVGVFVDTERHLVSFYDLTNRFKLYSFKECLFGDRKLYPYFCPCLNDGDNTSDWYRYTKFPLEGDRTRIGWKDYISKLALDRLGIPQDEVTNVAVLELLPPRPDYG